MNLETKGPEVLEVSYLIPEVVDYYWDQLSELLDREPELWNKIFTKQNIHDRIKNGEIQVWSVFNESVMRLVFFTQRYQAPNGIATLQIFWMYGSGLRGIMQLLDAAVDQFARKLDCQRIEITGRRGWARLLKPFDAEFQYSVWSRPVRTERGN